MSAVAPSGRRSPGIDLLKGLAILAVIAQHTLDGQLKETLLGGFWIDQAVPVFLILMSLNAARSLRRAGVTSLREAYTRAYLGSRISRLVAPASATYVLIAVLAAAQGRLHLGGLVLVGAAPVSGGAPGDYFVALAIALAALLPAAWVAYVRAPRATLAALIAVSAAFELSVRPLLHGSDAGAHLDVANPLRAAAAVAAGLWLAGQGGPSRAVVGRRSLLLAAAAASLVYLTALHVDAQYGDNDAFGVLFPNFTAETGVWALGWSLAVVAFATAALDRAAEGWARGRVVTALGGGLAELGQASYHVFLVQMVVLGLWPPDGIVATLGEVGLALAGGWLLWRLTVGRPRSTRPEPGLIAVRRAAV